MFFATERFRVFVIRHINAFFQKRKNRAFNLLWKGAHILGPYHSSGEVLFLKLFQIELAPQKKKLRKLKIASKHTFPTKIFKKVARPGLNFSYYRLKIAFSRKKQTYKFLSHFMKYFFSKKNKCSFLKSKCNFENGIGKLFLRANSI